MKIHEKEKQFQPLQFTLETELEVAELYSCLNSGSQKGAAQKLFDYLITSDRMNQNKADVLMEQ